ncbi:SMI1/KNR4 family protein [Bacillus cereus]|nr:SMI1/KNR4 family protein [Bacillus cereus]
MEISYNNIFKNVKEAISNTDIIKIEQDFSFKFPQEIREHYLLYNGGSPEKCVFIDEDDYEYVVHYFIPINHKNARGGGDLESTLNVVRVEKIIPDWLIPFANDPGGDLYCFSIKDGEEGSIYYWSHEYEYGENPEDHVFYLTNSLKTFIDSMVEDE